QADLFEVILAPGPVGSLTYLLHGGQQQTDEDSDDGNHYQQLDQGEAISPPDMKFSAHVRDSPTKEMKPRLRPPGRSRTEQTICPLLYSRRTIALRHPLHSIA